MNTLVAIFICIQAFFIQNVFSQCSSNYGIEYINNGGFGPRSVVPGIAPATFPTGVNRGSTSFGYTGALGAPGLFTNIGSRGYEISNDAAYIGDGEGSVAAAGELPVAGNTIIVGQVPVLGSVSFSGNLPASGSISISGRCSCSCDEY